MTRNMLTTVWNILTTLRCKHEGSSDLTSSLQQTFIGLELRGHTEDQRPAVRLRCVLVIPTAVTESVHNHTPKVGAHIVFEIIVNDLNI